MSLKKILIGTVLLMSHLVYAEGPEVEIDVHLASRKIQVVAENKILIEFDAAVGSIAHPTKEGCFENLVLDKSHTSSKYPSLNQMPYAIFYSGGYNIHGSSEPIRERVTQGAILVSLMDSEILYNITQQTEARGQHVRLCVK